MMTQGVRSGRARASVASPGNVFSAGLVSHRRARLHRPRPPGRSAGTTVAVSLADTWAAGPFALPIFPSTKLMIPAASGVLRAYEPCYLALFEELREKNGGRLEGATFGHFLSASSAPSALLRDPEFGAGGGLPVPRLGMEVRITAARWVHDHEQEEEEREGGGGGRSLLVTYEGVRRVKLLSLWQHQPYLVGAACGFEDLDPPDQQPGAAGGSAWPPNLEEVDGRDDAEQSLWGMLKEVGRLSRRLSAQSSPTSLSSPTSAASPPLDLPEPVIRFAPPPRAARSSSQRLQTSDRRGSSVEYLQDIGHPAGHAIALWLSAGSGGGSGGGRGGPLTRSRRSGGSGGLQHQQSDPYTAVQEEVGKAERQELFSFAAAAMVEIGPPEALALMMTRDTAARLAWVAAAVEPYLQELRARASVAAALSAPSSSSSSSSSSASLPSSAKPPSAPPHF